MIKEGCLVRHTDGTIGLVTRLGRMPEGTFREHYFVFRTIYSRLGGQCPTDPPRHNFDIKEGAGDSFWVQWNDGNEGWHFFCEIGEFMEFICESR